MSANPKFDLIKTHLDADTDSGITAIHHTLGHGAFQASPGSHRHDGTDSHKLRAGDLQTISATYQPTFTGTGLTFTGTPATGIYIKIGTLVHFRIKVRCTTVTNFGTGQYHLTLPFEPVDDYVFRDGGFHDASTGHHHAISADAEANTTQISLWHPGSSAKDVAFDQNTPIVLHVADYFYISGTYETEV